MVNRYRTLAGLVVVAALAALAAGASAQTVEGQLSAYTGVNAKGYLRPLNEALGVTLNNGFFYTARIPEDKFKISLEFPVMGVLFDDEDRTFNATTEEPFLPRQTVSTAPTIIGSGGAVAVDGQAGSQFLFPGGFALNSFGLVVPQLRGSYKGTEALVRIIAGVEAGDAELGKINLWGFGARHSISRYFDQLPVDLAGSFFYQSLSVGENSAGNDLLSVDAYSIGVHASKSFPFGFARVEPYSGLSYDSFKTEIEYRTTNETIAVDFERENTVHWAIGAGVNLVAAQVFAQYDFGLLNSFLFGVALGNVGY